MAFRTWRTVPAVRWSSTSSTAAFRSLQQIMQPLPATSTQQGNQGGQNCVEQGGGVACGWGVPIQTTGEKPSTLSTLWFEQCIGISGKTYILSFSFGEKDTDPDSDSIWIGIRICRPWPIRAYPDPDPQHWEGGGCELLLHGV
jgi:hypothetical protein